MLERTEEYYAVSKRVKQHEHRKRQRGERICKQGKKDVYGLERKKDETVNGGRNITAESEWLDEVRGFEKLCDWARWAS